MLSWPSMDLVNHNHLAPLSIPPPSYFLLCCVLPFPLVPHLPLWVLPGDSCRHWSWDWHPRLWGCTLMGSGLSGILVFFSLFISIHCCLCSEIFWHSGCREMPLWSVFIYHHLWCCPGCIMRNIATAWVKKRGQSPLGPASQWSVCCKLSRDGRLKCPRPFQQILSSEKQEYFPFLLPWFGIKPSV